MSLRGFVLPRDKIQVGQKLRGYSMEYINGKSIFELKLSTQQLIAIFKKISEYLKYYHQYGIIISDFNLSNIIFTSKSDFYFVDADSVKIFDLPHDSIPTITYNYLKSHNLRTSEITVDGNFDNLSAILNFLYVLFEFQPLYSLSQRQIDEYLEIKEIEEQKPFVRELAKKNISVPYFDQLFR